MYPSMARNWWVVALRGVIVLVFGLAALFLPGLTLRTLAILFGAFAFADGVLALGAAFGRDRPHGNQEGLLVIVGLLGIVIGLVTLLEPRLTLLFFVFLFAARAILGGIYDVVLAFELRKEISFEWLLGLYGVLSFLFGLLILFVPGAGLLVAVYVIGIYAIFAGVTLLARAWSLRSNPTTTKSVR
jgi:uncharacterized membrane protein HdeD (DUF308 family)